MQIVCSVEIKVHSHNIIAFLCCFLFDPSLTSARNQINDCAKDGCEEFFTETHCFLYTFFYIRNLDQAIVLKVS